MSIKNKLITGLLVIVSILVGGTFMRGCDYCKQRVEEAALKETNAAQAAVANVKVLVLNKIKVIQEKRSKKARTEKDKFISCILSSNPLLSDCN